MSNDLFFYQNIIYAGIFTWGVYAVLTDEPLTPGAETIPTWLYHTWIALHVLAPPVSWSAQIIRYKSRSLECQLRGWRLQRASDSAVCLMMSTYLIALHSYPQLVLLVGGLTLCGFSLTSRDTFWVKEVKELIRKRETESNLSLPTKEAPCPPSTGQSLEQS